MNPEDTSPDGAGRRKKRSVKNTFIIVAIFLTVAVGMLSIAAHEVWQGLGLPGYAETAGTVISKQGTSSTSYFFVYRVSFRTADNEVHEFSERVREGSLGFAGDEVVVRYDPGKPTRAIIAHEPTWSIIAITAIIGVFFLHSLLIFVIAAFRSRNGAR